MQEVWAIALPELHLLVDRPQLDGRTWLAFLARNPLYRCNDLLRRHIVRGIEQHAVNEIAVVLQISANLVSVRYRRALERLRLMLPEALLADLPDG